MKGEVVPIRLTAEQARELTDEAKRDVTLLWAKLYGLYEGEAHRALGYGDWGDYCEAEFGWSSGWGKHLLRAGRVRAVLERKDTTVSLPENEAVARELHPVLSKAPDELEDVWSEAVATAAGETPTAVEVRTVVDRRVPEVRPSKRRKRVTASDKRLEQVREYTEILREAGALLRRAAKRLETGKLTELALDDERGEWYTLIRRIEESASLVHETLAHQGREITKRRKGK